MMNKPNQTPVLGSKTPDSMQNNANKLPIYSTKQEACNSIAVKKIIMEKLHVLASNLQKSSEDLNKDSLIQAFKKNHLSFLQKESISDSCLELDVTYFLQKHSTDYINTSKKPKSISEAAKSMKRAGRLLSREDFDKAVALLDQQYLEKIKSQRKTSTSSPSRYMNLGLKDFEPKNNPQKALKENCIKLSKAVMSKKEFNLFVLGHIGTGKTMCLSALVNDLNADGKKAILTTITCMLNHVKSFYKVSIADVNSCILKYSEADLLVVDEADLMSLTNSNIEIFNTIMNNRYNRMLNTVFVSNKNLNYLQEVLGYRAIDRMKANGQNAVINLEFSSLRGKP